MPARGLSSEHPHHAIDREERVKSAPTLMLGQHMLVRMVSALP